MVEILFFRSSRRSRSLAPRRAYRSLSSSMYSHSSIPDEVWEEDGEEGVIQNSSPSLSKEFGVLAASSIFLFTLIFSNAAQRLWDQHTGWNQRPIE